MICAYSSIVQLQSYASTLAKQQVSPPDIVWSHDRSKVAYKGEWLVLDNLRNGLNKMGEDVEKLMDDIALGTKIPYAIPDNLKDDMSDSSIGYSWLDNAHFMEEEDALLKLLINDPNFKLAELDRSQNFCWNHVRAHSLMMKLTQINRLLNVLLHIIPDQPARGTEHVEIKIRNNLRHRNVFWHDDRLWIVTQYTKTTNLTGHDSFLPMMLPRRLSRILERYLIVYRPLEKVLGNVLYGKNAMQNYHEFLFVEMGDTVSSPSFSNTLKKLCKSYMGVEFTLGPMRHSMIAIKREHILPMYWLSVMDEDEIGDTLSGHSSEMARTHYAVQSGSHPTNPGDTFQVCGTFCGEWHNVLSWGEGAVPKALSHSYQPGANNRDPNTSSFGGIDPESLQAMISVAVRDTLMQCIPSVLEKLAVPRPVPLPEQEYDDMYVDEYPSYDETSSTLPPSDPMSTESLPPSDPMSTGSFPPSDPMSTELLLPSDPMSVDPSQLQPVGEVTNADDDDMHMDTFLSDLPDEVLDRDFYSDDVVMNDAPAESSPAYDPLQALRHCYHNEDMEFKSKEQEMLVASVLSRKSDILAILPTGGGKSAAFEVPAAVEEGLQTVLIVPFLVLIQDILLRAERIGIKASRWDSQTPWPSCSEASLIVMTVDAATGPVFHA